MLFYMILFISGPFSSDEMHNQQYQQPDLRGEWKGSTERGDIKVKIMQDSDSSYYGIVMEDANNSKNKGKLMLKEVVFNKKEKCYSGKMMPPDIDLQLNVIITQHSPGQLKMVARRLFMSKTILLSRIN